MTKKILIIGSKYSSKNDIKKIHDSFIKHTPKVTLKYWEDIYYSIINSDVSVGWENYILLENHPDLVITFGWYRNDPIFPYKDVAYSLALFLKHHNIKFWNQEMLHQRSTTKLSCMVQLALEQIPIPNTHFQPVNALSPFQPPYILKAVAASRGQYNYMITSQREETLIKQQNRKTFITQEFLPNDHDLRVLCFNAQPKLVLKRKAICKNSHLNNISQGGKGEWLALEEVSKEVLTLSEKICKIMKREMAGIDFIPNESVSFGYSCLEVNSIPQLTSGFDSSHKLTALYEAIKES